MSTPATYFKKGALVASPASDEVAIIAESDGSLKSLTSAGVRTALGGGTSRIANALARAQSLMPTSGINVYMGSELENDQWHVFTSGTGTPTAAISTTDKGGRYLLSTSATANSLGSFQAHGSGSFIDNPRTTPWYLYVRGKFTTAMDAAAYMAICGLASPARVSPAFAIGAIGAPSTVNFCAYAQDNGGVSRVSLDLGIPYDTVDHDFEMWSDGATLFAGMDFVTKGSAANTLVGTSPVTPVLQWANGATAANRAMNIDTIFCAIAGG